MSTQSDALSRSGDIASAPFYQKRTIYSNQFVREYRTFKNEVIKQGNSETPPQFLFSAFKCIKPDGSKLVQSMLYIGQINIIDVASGQVTGYRIKNTPDFSYIFKSKYLRPYYVGLQADDNYIYALYSGEEINNSSNTQRFWHIIHIFDWNGNLIKKLDTDQHAGEIAIDIHNNLLYTLDTLEDRFFVYDLNQLNLK
jgi:DNA-binding beta-propeller fold protein YncE